MSDSAEGEKGVIASTSTDNNSSNTPYNAHASEESGHQVVGKPWMYKKFKLGPLTLPFYASPPSQLVLVAFVCFLCPGMYNSISGLGAGGQLSAHDVDNSTVALYSTFAIVGFFAGSIANTIGLRWTLFCGGFGYFLYTSSLLCYNNTANSGFLIFSGALLGVCAALLWTAQGAIMTSYPPEASKGKYISWFWMIFNMGGVIGSLIPLGENLHKTTSGSVSNGTYIGFMVLMFFGFILAFFLVDSKSVQRADGSHVIVMKNPTWKSELLGLVEVLRTDAYIILLFPMFFASNWFYTYQFNGINAAYFNVRTRALNNTLYWTSQIIGAFIFGYALDTKVRRVMRARGAFVGLFVLTMVIWGGGYAWEKKYTRATVSADDFVPWDFTTSGYVGPMFLMMFYGFYDAAWQTCVYWYMGALTNNARKLANFTGFYKGIQSAGAAIIWRLDALSIPYLNEYASSWGLLVGALIFAAPVIFMKIKDTVDLEEDLKFSDETVADVAGDEVMHGIDGGYKGEGSLKEKTVE